MFEEVKISIEKQDYLLAKELLNQLLSQGKNELWIRYYLSLILEKEGNLSLAEKQYRDIIKESIYPDPKLLKLIRDGIERIVKINQEIQKKDLEEREKIKQEKIQQLKNFDNGEELAVLVLVPVSNEDKKKLAPQLAKIMGWDNYTATLQIPTRSLRIYKTGNFAELNYYQSELLRVDIPCLCYQISAVNQMDVYEVQYILEEESSAKILCENDSEEEIIVNFLWQDIDNKIQAIVPIFEQTLHFDGRGKPIKKTGILDYVQFFDLHLINQNIILRFCDHFYNFDRGLTITKNGQTTKEKWHNLINYINSQIPDKKLWSDFTLFAEGAVYFPEMLKQITAHINLFRREESLWDEAFQLYSGLIFVHSKNTQNLMNNE